MKEFVLSQDMDGTWIVTCEKVPGFPARGKTREEAIEKMKQAMRVYFPCGDCNGSD
jgi:predicted RNase H-like HicB family nuclease